MQAIWSVYVEWGFGFKEYFYSMTLQQETPWLYMLAQFSVQDKAVDYVLHLRNS